jgi:hypothetical protein
MMGTTDSRSRKWTSVAAALTAERVGDNHLSGKEDKRPRPPERQRLLSSRDPSPEPSHGEAGSNNKLDNSKANSDEDDGKLRLEPSNDDNGYYSEDEKGRSSTNKHSL